MAATPKAWRVVYYDREGRRCTKFVAAHSPDGAVGQVPEAERVERILECPDIVIETETP